MLRRKVCRALVLLAAAASAGVAARAEPRSPAYRVDPFWPQQLPNNWILGQVGGMAVDAQGHLWVLQRPRTVPEVALGLAATPPTTACCITAPAVLEFGADGKVMRSWGGPGGAADWPDTEHGIHVDGDSNVWITGNGRTDRMVIKFSPEGRHLLTIGKKTDAPLNNQDVTMLGRPSGLAAVSVSDNSHLHRTLGSRDGPSGRQFGAEDVLDGHSTTLSLRQARWHAGSARAPRRRTRRVGRRLRDRGSRARSPRSARPSVRS